MSSNFNRLIDIIEDRVSMEISLRIIEEFLESGKKPNEGTFPCFNDELMNEILFSILEKIASLVTKEAPPHGAALSNL